MIELMLASAIMSALVLALAVMSDAVQRGNEHAEGYTLSAQHARVVCDRIKRHVCTATANAAFPGLYVFSETVDGQHFPDTLVVWAPGGQAAQPDGLPLVSELVVYAPNPNAPHELLEITDRTNGSTAPSLTNQTGWRTLLRSLKTGTSSKKVLLTDLLRVVPVRPNDHSTRRGMVRFVHRLTPSEWQWMQYQGGVRRWSELDWSQSVCGANFGLRQSWVRFEMQLTPGAEVVANNAGAMPAMPFFGSGARYYPLQRAER